MIRALFARLTDRPKRGQPLFDSAVTEARRPHWFEQGAVPDTLEGRFAILATVTALFTVRLEHAGPPGEAASVALTERFIEAMDAEIRQMGVGDPALGRQVRSLVGALASRVAQWHSTTAGDGDWPATILRSVYRDKTPPADALAHSEDALRGLWRRLEQTGDPEMLEGRLG